MFVRLFTGPDGESHFEDMDPAYAPGRTPGSARTATQAANTVAFNVMEPGSFSDWHHAPARQYVITVTGVIEITVGDGTTRRLGPGDVLLAEDLTGRGHTTRVIGTERRLSTQVVLAD